MKLYDYLGSQVKTLNDAHDFFKKWHKEWDQEVPGFGKFGWRSMAAHLSNVLEGKPEPGAGEFLTYYLDTKYGVQIYNGIRDD